MATKASLLETIAWATLTPRELFPKLAMRWRQEYPHGREQEDREAPALRDWVRQRLGALFPAAEELAWAHQLAWEIERQTNRVRQKDRTRTLHVPTGPEDYPEHQRINVRRHRLLIQVLGLPMKWVASKWVHERTYFCGHISLDFVAGLISTDVMIKGGKGRHRLLVYREKGRKPKAYWVAPQIMKISDALTWLQRPAVYKAREAGAQVVFDGQRQVHRLIYPDGRVTRVRWRRVVAYG